MTLNRDTVLKIVLETLHELGEDLDRPELQEADETTRLFGARSALDSINLVNLIADLEERLNDDFEIEITLADQTAMSQTHSPFRRVGSCVDYIMELTSDRKS